MSSKKVARKDESDTTKYVPKKAQYSREQIMAGAVMVIMALSALVRVVTPFLRLR